MDIKSRQIKIFFLIFIFLFSFLISGSIIPASNSGEFESRISRLNTSDITFIDKVYTFTVEEPNLLFNDLILEQFYTYYFSVTVVTPHLCAMDIMLWDPAGDKYYISFEENMTQGDEREIPFGTAMEGNYDIQFSAQLTENINVRVKIERGVKVLYDNIMAPEQSKIMYYNVSKVSDGALLTTDLLFNTDKSYKFYFSRVSAISTKFGASSYYVLMDHFIQDPEGIRFKIYRNEEIAGPNNITKYKFGTQITGYYVVTIIINCQVDWVNIAFAIVDDGHISDEIEQEYPTNSTNNSTNKTENNVRIYIPHGWAIGVFAFFGAVFGIPILVVVYRKKKNATGL
ncbi:hypothetical protein LCGC14_2028180 [marine sediment metagenome]|uniref:Uncharacterized protein n=1 Tax=marine sediment metagenome TaxID=412755 RepID=A0A0F9EVC2_9ZZZZ